MFYEDFLYDQFVVERNARCAYQGILDNCEDVGITEAQFHQAQAPLKPTVRRPDPIDYERMRKYFGHVPADIVRQTFKHTTQIGLLPPSTHLCRQFNLLILHSTFIVKMRLTPLTKSLLPCPLSMVVKQALTSLWDKTRR